MLSNIVVYGIGTLGAFVFMQYTHDDAEYKRGTNFAQSLVWPIMLPVDVILNAPKLLDKLDKCLSPK